MTVLQVILPNGGCATAFCIEWREQLVMATCDHLFLTLEGKTKEVLTFSDGKNSCSGKCELRRHETADVAVILPFEDLKKYLSPLKFLRSVSQSIPDPTAVFVEGFLPRATTLTSYQGNARQQKLGTKNYRHPIAGLRQYSGVLVPNTLPGVPGLSGSPIRQIGTGGVISVYACSGDSLAFTDGFHAGHLEEII